MDVIAVYDYYFLDDPHRRFDDRCEYGLCEKSIVYRRMRFAVDECSGRSLYRQRARDGEEVEERKEGSTEIGLGDVLDYMTYNVPSDTGLPAYYSCCMYLYKKRLRGDDETFGESGHVCNAIPLMIGSRLEAKVLARLADLLCVRASDIFDADYLHRVYAGSFLVNGTFYYSVFRESNNNKICHNSKSKQRGDETVAYFYDNTCNRGVKLFTNRYGQLRVNDRDGNEVKDVTPDVMRQLYEECPYNAAHYTLDMDVVRGFFSAVKEQGVGGIDNLKNKIYTNYTTGLNAFLDKLPADAMTNPTWNAALMVGKINFGISQRLIYSKSKSEAKKQNEQKLKMCSGRTSTGYLVESQRRRGVRRIRAVSPARPFPNASARDDIGVTAGLRSTPQVAKRKHEGCGLSASDCTQRRETGVKRCKTKHGGADGPEGLDRTTVPIEAAQRPVPTILGSKNVNTSGLMERLDRGENSGPSIFNQVSVSYLPLIRVMSNTVQKLQVEHVHAESSKTVPRDAYGFICMRYVGNISTAGKNMLFADRVEVAYGHVHRAIRALEDGVEGLASGRVALDGRTCVSNGDSATGVVKRSGGTGEARWPSAEAPKWWHLVINNAVTVWRVARAGLIGFLVYVKARCHRFAWIKIVGDYLCVYYYEGVPLLRYERGEMMFDLLERAIAVCDKGPGRWADPLARVDHLYFSRDELETLVADHLSTEIRAEWFAERTSTSTPTGGAGRGPPDAVDRTNKMIDRLFMRSRPEGGYAGVEHASLLAKQVDQYTEHTAPAKRSVSVNARKSACVNVRYQKAADLIPGFNIFTDPEGYESATARRLASEHGPPEWVTRRDFARARAEPANCPQPQDGTNKAHLNFYLCRTAYGDVKGSNVEDANVLDTSVDFKLRYNITYTLSFVDRTAKGLDITVPPPEDAASVCCWDSRGEPTTVLFMVCTIRKREGETCGGSDIVDMLRASPGARVVDGEDDTLDDCESSRGTCGGDWGSGPGGEGGKRPADDAIHFPPYRKLSVIRSADGSYHVYFMRDDAVLLRCVRRLRRRMDGGVGGRVVPDASNALRCGEDAYAFVCKPEVKVYDVLTSLRTRVTTFGADSGGRVVTVDVRVHGRSDKYDGVKIVNSFGQKGLAVIKDLRPFFGGRQPTYDHPPVQLVMNNCSFVSRQPIGQYLQMRKNMYGVVESSAGEPTAVGYTPVFITETEPITKTCLVRFDEMMRSVIITLGLTVFQNLKSSLDNKYNPYGVLYPPHTRHIMSLYRCFGVSYKFSRDTYTPFSNRDEVQKLFDVYEEYSKIPKPTAVHNGFGSLLDLVDSLHTRAGRRRLLRSGRLKNIRVEHGGCLHDSTGPLSEARRDGSGRCCCKTYVVAVGNDCGGAPPPQDFQLRRYTSRDDSYSTVYFVGSSAQKKKQEEEQLRE